MENSGSLFKGVMLVAGTTIGGGMLGLPLETGQAGFYPSLFAYLIAWVFMAGTGLLFLEVCLWMKRETNLVSMAEETLGKPGMVVTWILYLFLFSSLTLAYVVGGGNMISEATNETLPDYLGSFLFVLIFGGIVWAGAGVVGKLNLPLMLGLGISFFAFLYLGFPHIEWERLKTAKWSHLPYCMPIIFATFGYQGLVPTLTQYMGFDAKKTRQAILYGSAIPLLTYIIWQGLILGIVPVEGTHGLVAAAKAGQNAVRPMKHFIQSGSVIFIGASFAFFAITTSFLGVTLGLVDFLADGLKVKKTPLGRLILCLIIFVPALIVGLIYPQIFLKALELAGGIGVAGLLGFMPILMVWRGRYVLKKEGERILPGGRIALSLLLVFVIIEFIFEFTLLSYQ